ncbi:MAG: dipeptidase [Gemmatimonadota bacterium]|nr:MAG: dipeptidase [Gemmatimonadota bacterium]
MKSIGESRVQHLIFPALVLALAACSRGGDVPSERAREIADYAWVTYSDATVEALVKLVSFRTVQEEGVDNAENPEFRGMSDYLEGLAAELGLDFADHGNVVVIGLGDTTDRLGVVTHGDVQPADPSKWVQSPFSLDSLSEPDRLIGRGAEDDKGPIATALYAMKAVSDQGLPLGRRIELIISYTEESNWAPFQAFLAENPPPDLNVALDSEYPVVVAEKSWNAINLALAPVPDEPVAGPNRLIDIGGGAFMSQVPGDAWATIAEPSADLRTSLRNAAIGDSDVSYDFVPGDGTLTVEAHGLAAHSSKPEEGHNAITHLAALLGPNDWPDGQAARMVRLINDLVGTGDYAELFGEVALTNSFMGRLTLALTTLGREDDRLVAGINIRSPVGRDPDELERLIREAAGEWMARTGIEDLEVGVFSSPAHYPEDAPHIPVLLDIFEFYTGISDPQPISIGGGTHARLMPNGVNFGPAMPGEVYTGHSEHEFISREQLELNLRMVTAMLVELAGQT